MKAETGKEYDDLRLNIARLRDERGYSQSQLARALKLPQSTYTGYELGIRKFPLTVVKQIADAFGVTVDFLLRDAQDGQIPEYLSVKWSAAEAERLNQAAR
ncbi:MAG: helix-turn-helix transcriptional regulator, partial [Defluviitaleaceae bacterium]|nr:helix-turn-helix transcriptional regulator [Defluviitaleaceae bacterium]